MATSTAMRERVGARTLGDAAFEFQACMIFTEAERAAALIPDREFEDIFQSAPDLEYHHRFVQSILTWIWYEVNENEVPLDCLPDILQGFYLACEETFAAYWA
ncbi:MAG: hypothetical protein ACK2UK_14290 [Candidatus Promineifilaceae bacterium]